MLPYSVLYPGIPDHSDALLHDAGATGLILIVAGMYKMPIAPERGRTNRHGVVSIGVEWRVQLDEVNRRRVVAAQDVEVVSGPNGSIGEVGHVRNTATPV